MDDDLYIDRIGWCRAGARHRYVGGLWVSEDGIRLAGRDALHGIEVSLSIPVIEIERVDVELSRSESSQGEACVVLTLADSSPVLVWEVGAHQTRLVEVANHIATLPGAGAERPFAVRLRQDLTGGSSNEGTGHHDRLRAYCP